MATRGGHGGHHATFPAALIRRPILAGTAERVEAFITRAMAWADELHATYQASQDLVRLFRQAAFKRILHRTRWG